MGDVVTNYNRLPHVTGVFISVYISRERICVRMNEFLVRVIVGTILMILFKEPIICL